MKSIVLRILVYAITAGFAFNAFAQEYPTKPIRIVVPSLPGSSSDIEGRILSDKLTKRVGQQVIVDNRAGAGGKIGMEVVANSPADGYTIILGTMTAWAVNPNLYKQSIDVVKDFDPIIQCASSPAVLVVNPSLPVKNVDELIRYAKANSGQLNYGSAGIGGFGHISGELFTMMTKTKMTHVPYKSTAPALTALMSGELQVLFNNVMSTVPYINSGRMRPLATTGLTRSSILPNLPTIAESGVANYENLSWSGIGVPAGTPKPIIARLHKEFSEILIMPDIQKKYAEMGAQITGGTPEQFHAYLKAELDKFGRIVREAAIQGASAK